MSKSEVLALLDSQESLMGSQEGHPIPPERRSSFRTAQVITRKVDVQGMV